MLSSGSRIASVRTSARRLIALALLTALPLFGADAQPAATAADSASSAGRRIPPAAAAAPVAPMCADGTCDAPLDLNVWAGAWTGGQKASISDANLPVGTWITGITPNSNV